MLDCSYHLSDHRAFVMMMQTADFWQLSDRTHFKVLNRSRRGYVHVERAMCRFPSVR
jgi:hypothetical protein